MGSKRAEEPPDGKERNSAEVALAQLAARTEFDYHDFYGICARIFGEDRVKENQPRLREIFGLFADGSGSAIKDRGWKIFCDWIKACVEPVNVLLIVDVQNDFIDGSLALKRCGCGQDGAEVVAPINRLIAEGTWSKIIYSFDWHPDDHISFYENLHMRHLHPDSKISKETARPFDTVIFSKPYLEQILWPKHCVQNTWGAELHKDLKIATSSEQVLKGQDSEREAYSVFFENPQGVIVLKELLSEIGATHLFVCGLAYDVCIKRTCLDGLRFGYPLAVVDDCCRGIDPENVELTKKLILENGGIVLNSEDVLSLVNKQKQDLIMAHKVAERMTLGLRTGNSVTNHGSGNSLSK